MNREISERISKTLIGKYGKDSRRWKGESASYSAKHMWIIKHYGKEKKRKKCGNTNCKRYEWANISGKYKREIEDYIQLCPSCHRKLDLNKKICPQGHKYDEKNTYITKQGWKVCRKCRAESQRRYKLICNEK